MSKKVKNIVRIVIRVNNEVLIVKRSEQSSLNPGTWEFPGGKVDFGESYEEAGHRELIEETGIEADIKDIITTSSMVDGDIHILVLVYELILQNKPKVHLSSEHIEYEWLSLDQIEQYTYVSADYVNFLENYLEYKSNPNKSPDINMHKSGETSKTGVAVIYSDGGSRGNPGPSATGYVIYDSEENELARGGTYLGIATNNQAEYLAVKEGLVRAKELGLSRVKYYLDSMLVVKQMSGEYKIKNKDLWPIHQSIKDLRSEFDNVTFSHVRREHNKVADSIVNEVLDEHRD